MDLSKLSTEDLMALKSGDMSKVSTEGLLALRGEQPPPLSGAQAAADDVGRGQAFVIGAGKATDSILDGITQMYLSAKGEDKALSGLRTNVEAKREDYQPLKEKYPFVTGAGETLPALAVPVGGAGASLLGMMGRSAIATGTTGALEYGTPEERAKRGIVNAAAGAVGGAVGRGAARLLRPAGVGRAGLSADATGAASRLGVRLSPGQQSQNAAMQNFENYLARSPGSSGAMQARSAANQAAMNSGAASAMGQSAEDLSESTFAVAKKAIGDEFQRLQSVTAPQLGGDFFKALAEVDSANAARSSFRSASIDKLVDKGLDLAAQGKLTGAAYKEIRTTLSNDAQSAFKAGDATLGQALKTIRAALDDAAKQSLSAADQKAWDLTRSQWAAYKALTRSNVTEGGNVSAARLAGALRQQGDGLRTGAMQGPLSDIARLGEAVKGVQNPNSGQLTQQMLYGNPFTGVPLLLGNKATQAVYTNPLVERYMARGLLDVGPNGRLLLGRAAGPVAAPLVREYIGAQ